MSKEILSAKKRDKKVRITDIAIEKIPKIKYQGLSDTESDILYQMARLCLLTSQKDNDSNEVAVTVTLDSKTPLDVVGIAYGNEHEIDICADTLSNHLIVSAQKCAVIILHNHPSTQTLSLEDIRFFLSYRSIKMMAVVTNQGTIHYLTKLEEYDYQECKRLYDDCISGLTGKSPAKDFYIAGLTFLARCSETGLFYR